MKKQQTTQTPKYTCCSTRQKVLALVALGGLFACGLMIGVAINGGTGITTKRIAMTDEQCEKIADRMVNVVRGDWNVNAGKSQSEINENLRELNEIYTKNCAGRSFSVDDSKPEPAPQRENTANQKTCEVIENMLVGWLNDETTIQEDLHLSNIEVYKRLIKNGCPENAEKYQTLIQREQEILAALNGSTNAQTCMEIEGLLTQELQRFNNYNSSDDRIERAKIYANLSERGCAENAAKYTDMAARELEIARALRDDKFSEYETTEVVETYKRLEMKQQAKEVLNKVQKLTDPAIDFILQIQKIIEE